MALGLSIGMVLVMLLLLPLADRPWPNAPGFHPMYQTAITGACLITAYLMYGHFKATRLTPLLHLSAAYLYTAGVLIMEMLSFKGMFIEGESVLGSPQATHWLTFFWHLGPAVGVLFFALELGRGSNAGTGARPYAVRRTAFALIVGVTATAVLTFLFESELPALNVYGDNSSLLSKGLAPAIQVMFIAALGLLWRGSHFRNVLHVWLGVLVVAFLCGLTLAMGAGEQLTLGWYMGRLYDLLGLSVVGFIYLRAIHQSHRLNLAATEELAFTNSVLDEEVRTRTAYALQLEQAVQRKDEFLVMLAHELRNPLAPIRAASDLLGCGKADEAMVQNVSRMLNRQVVQMSRLVEDLMDMSRVASGRLVLQRAVVDMHQVLADSVEQTTPQIEQRRLLLRTSLCQQPALVQGDHGRLVQVVTNLLNNAAKYTDPGGQIILGLEVQGERRELVVTVADTGIGMTPEILETAFVLFSQAKVTPERSRGGLGLGLALVKSIVELHHGTVRATSQGPGSGSEFSVILPLSS